MDETTQVVTIVIVLIALVVTVIGAQFVRRRRDIYPLRPQSAYAMLPLMIGESVEADRPLHISVGATGIGGDSTALAVASADLLYAAAQRSAGSGTNPLFTTSDASSLALGYSVLWRAYAESRSAAPRWSRARWYPAGEQSLIFAGALATISADERPTGHFLVGRFGAEVAIVLESARRRRQRTAAMSITLDGQAAAYALSDYPIIGEELYTAGAYLEGRASQVGGIIALDVLRVLVILGLVIAVFVRLQAPLGIGGGG